MNREAKVATVAWLLRHLWSLGSVTVSCQFTQSPSIYHGILSVPWSVFVRPHFKTKPMIYPPSSALSLFDQIGGRSRIDRVRGVNLKRQRHLSCLVLNAFNSFGGRIRAANNKQAIERRFLPVFSLWISYLFACGIDNWHLILIKLFPTRSFKSLLPQVHSKVFFVDTLYRNGAVFQERAVHTRISKQKFKKSINSKKIK